MKNRIFKRSWIPLLLCVTFLGACGEPKTYKLERVNTMGATARFYVEGKITGVGDGILRYKVGDTEYSNLRIEDATGSTTFHFLPANFTRQPVVGDNAKLLIQGKFVDQTWGGSPTVQVIEKIEYR